MKPWGQEDRNRWARASDRAAKEAREGGNDTLAEQYEAEAKSWRAGKPKSFVPRAR